MITLYDFHEYILSYHNILDFWSAKKPTSQSILYDYGFITSTKMFSSVFSFDIESNVMPLIQKKTILKDFENHKLRGTMKYRFKNKIFLFIWINKSTSQFSNVNFWYNIYNW
jgi:hypothetical protein